MTDEIVIALEDETPSLDIVIEIPGREAHIEEYDGAYVVIPAEIRQTLPCALKKMREDVDVLAIPYAETTNPAGGYTATVG